ncbi:MAG: DMT family transporter [Eubacteriales bacterium]|nr:DMT family transporter [Eubacteriales bacterium]
MNDHERKNIIVGTLCHLLAAFLFGFSFLFVKITVENVSALTLLAWRFFIAFAAMGLMALLRAVKLDLKGKNLRPLLMIAVFQPVIYYLAETTGIKLTTASESGTLLACIPIVTLIFSGPLLHEPPTKRQVVSIVLSVLGVTGIALVKGFSSSLNVLGYALLTVAMFSDSFFVLFSRKASAFSSAEKTFVMMALGALVFCGAAFVEHGINNTVGEFLTLPFRDTNFLWSVLYLGVGCCAIGFFLCNYGIELLGATRSASFAGLTTVISVLAGVIILKEAFSLWQGAGTLAVLLGLYGANMLPRGARKIEEVKEQADETEEHA